MDALKRILKKHGIKLTVIFVVFGGAAYLFAGAPKYKGYAPDQPIPFSHKIHAGEVGVDCRFCHVNTERSAQASIPDTATCMKCHEVIASDSPNIQYLRTSYKAGMPIRWLKVHDLPDHAKFSHKPHISRGFQCADCHGAVDKMDKVEVASDFNMGWCIKCHRDNAAKFPDIQDTKPGHNRSVHLTECGTCHY
ncbi:MAG: cytochrome c3 family protein [Spirochaetia bacterium]|nr:cytochrome c3 family protein [Spirochaetia bacterium]